MNMQIPLNINKFITVLFMSLSLVLAGLSPAYSADKTITILEWKYNGPTEMAYTANAMDDMFFSRLASISGLEVTKTKKSATTIDEAIKALGKSESDYVFFGSLSALGDSISIDGHLVWVKGKSSVPFTMSGTGAGSLVGIADKVAGEIEDTIRGVVKTSSGETSRDTTAPTYNGKFDNQMKVVAVSQKDKEEGDKKDTPQKTEEIEDDKKSDEEPSDFLVKKKSSKGKKDFIFKTELEKGFIKSITAVDLNKDGIKEIITLSGKNIYINQFNGEELKLIKKIGSPKGTKHITLSVHHGEGVVYIASLVGGKASSKSLAYVDGDYKVVAEDVNYIIKVLTSGGVEALVGQEYQYGRGFLSTYHVLSPDFESLEEITFPKGLNILSLQVADFTGDGSDDVVGITKDNHIKMFEAGDEDLIETWISADKFGGSLDKVEFGKTRARTTSGGTSSVIFHSGFKVYDTNSDNTPEIVSKANIAGGFMGQFAKTKRRFDKGTIKSISYDGAQMTTDWETKEMQGYISDFAVADIDNDGKKDIVVVLLPKGKIGSKPKSQIIAYRLY